MCWGLKLRRPKPPYCAYVFKCWPTLGLVVMVSTLGPATIAALFGLSLLCLHVPASQICFSGIPTKRIPPMEKISSTRCFLLLFFVLKRSTFATDGVSSENRLLSEELEFPFHLTYGWNAGL